ncbi:DUF6188 family protein [Rhodococcus sp. BE178]|uniref:DUF6188 family protein n=1 Tax=Rhodococcus sp. BE178 TaxID=2817737 RepID=UPI003D253974
MSGVGAIILGVGVGIAAWSVFAGLTCVGARRRGARWPMAVLSGALFLAAWVVWYIRDEHPFGAAGGVEDRPDSIPRDGSIDLGLAGRRLVRVERVEADADLTLEFSGGDRVAIGPGNIAPGSAPVPGLIGERCAAATCTEEGSLEIRFTNDGRIRVSHDDDVEAWELSGADGRRVISLPGGGVARWSPR